MDTTGSMRALDESTGAVRVEDVYATGIDDLWEACTSPDRLSRWLAEVSGAPRVGETVDVVFTSTWSGQVRIEVCEEPRHLLVISGPGTDEESEIEAWLMAEGEDRTRLVVEERGLPITGLHYYGSGWQAHLEDLGRSLMTGASVHPDGWSASKASPTWESRWTELIPIYQEEGSR